MLERRTHALEFHTADANSAAVARQPDTAWPASTAMAFASFCVRSEFWTPQFASILPARYRDEYLARFNLIEQAILSGNPDDAERAYSGHVDVLRRTASGRVVEAVRDPTSLIPQSRRRRKARSPA